MLDVPEPEGLQPVGMDRIYLQLEIWRCGGVYCAGRQGDHRRRTVHTLYQSRNMLLQEEAGSGPATLDGSKKCGKVRGPKGGPLAVYCEVSSRRSVA